MYLSNADCTHAFFSPSLSVFPAINIRKIKYLINLVCTWVFQVGYSGADLSNLADKDEYQRPLFILLLLLSGITSCGLSSQAIIDIV